MKPVGYYPETDSFYIGLTRARRRAKENRRGRVGVTRAKDEVVASTSTDREESSTSSRSSLYPAATVAAMTVP